MAVPNAPRKKAALRCVSRCGVMSDARTLPDRASASVDAPWAEPSGGHPGSRVIAGPPSHAWKCSAAINAALPMRSAQALEPRDLRGVPPPQRCDAQRAVASVVDGRSRRKHGTLHQHCPACAPSPPSGRHYPACASRHCPLQRMRSRLALAPPGSVWAGPSGPAGPAPPPCLEGGPCSRRSHADRAVGYSGWWPAWWPWPCWCSPWPGRRPGSSTSSRPPRIPSPPTTTPRSFPDVHGGAHGCAGSGGPSAWADPGFVGGSTFTVEIRNVGVGGVPGRRSWPARPSRCRASLSPRSFRFPLPRTRSARVLRWWRARSTPLWSAPPRPPV